MKYTKLPLKLYTDSSYEYKISDANGLVVATLDKDRKGAELSREIVHRVNHFDAVMEALEELVSGIDRSQFRLAQDCLGLGKARTALKLANP